MSEHKQFETNGITVLAVTLNDNENLHSVEDGRLYYSYISSDNGSEQLDFKSIPKNDWSILAFASEITDEQAEPLVLYTTVMGQIRAHDYEFNGVCFVDWISSLHSLLRSHGIDPKQKNVLLIRKS